MTQRAAKDERSRRTSGPTLRPEPPGSGGCSALGGPWRRCRRAGSHTVSRHCSKSSGTQPLNSIPPPVRHNNATGAHLPAGRSPERFDAAAQHLGPSPLTFGTGKAGPESLRDSPWGVQTGLPSFSLFLPPTNHEQQGGREHQHAHGAEPHSGIASTGGSVLATANGPFTTLRGRGTRLPRRVPRVSKLRAG